MGTTPDTRYSILPDGTVLDSAPLHEGKGIFALDTSSGKWVTWNGTGGAWKDSKLITAEEAARFCEDGTLPDGVRRRLGSSGCAP